MNQKLSASILAHVMVFLFLILPLTGCQKKSDVKPTPQSEIATAPTVVPLQLKQLPDAIRREQEIRAKRLQMLAKKYNISSPSLVDDLQVQPGVIKGVNYPVPVMRLRFNENVFFDSASDDVRPESINALNAIAEQMKDDIPDTSLLVLGHTDSVGSDEYNEDLSIRRAYSVMTELVQKGVSSEQISTIGIGENQPVATNATEDGRAKNRRVEFLFARFAQANYLAVEMYPRNVAWLNNHETNTVHVDSQKTKKLKVLKLATTVNIDDSNGKVSSISNADKQQASMTSGQKNKAELIDSSITVTLLPPDSKTVELLPQN